MKILAIGDSHGDLDKIKKIPKKDIELIILTGDLGKSEMMRTIAFENVERKKKGLPEKEYSNKLKKKCFMEAYDSTIKIVEYLSKFAPVYIIYGNVESSNAETREYSKEIGVKLPFLTDKLKRMKNVKIINKKRIKINGFYVGGIDYFTDVSWVKTFKPEDYAESLKIAVRHSKKARKILNKFGKIDVLVCHQPPYGVLDKVGAKFAPKHWKGRHAGSKVILEYIKKYEPYYVFCGHIHEGEGFELVGKTEVYNLGAAGYKIIELK
jgi:Icc-related predicted phosphoesterase